MWSNRAGFFFDEGLEYIEAMAIFLTKLVDVACLGVRIAHTISTPYGILIKVFVMFWTKNFLVFTNWD